MKRSRLLRRLLASPRNVAFTDLQNLMEGFGFRLARVRGSHHVFSHPDIPELINIQEVDGQAKPYQVRQFLKLVERHDLQLEDDA